MKQDGIFNEVHRERFKWLILSVAFSIIFCFLYQSNSSVYGPDLTPYLNIRCQSTPSLQNSIHLSSLFAPLKALLIQEAYAEGLEPPKKNKFPRLSSSFSSPSPSPPKVNHTPPSPPPVAYQRTVSQIQSRARQIWGNNTPDYHTFTTRLGNEGVRGHRVSWAYERLYPKAPEHYVRPANAGQSAAVTLPGGTKIPRGSSFTSYAPRTRLRGGDWTINGRLGIKSPETIIDGSVRMGGTGRLDMIGSRVSQHGPDAGLHIGSGLSGNFRGSYFYDVNLTDRGSSILYRNNYFFGGRIQASGNAFRRSYGNSFYKTSIFASGNAFRNSHNNQFLNGTRITASGNAFRNAFNNNFNQAKFPSVSGNAFMNARNNSFVKAQFGNVSGNAFRKSYGNLFQDVTIGQASDDILNNILKDNKVINILSMKKLGNGDIELVSLDANTGKWEIKIIPNVGGVRVERVKSDSQKAYNIGKKADEDGKVLKINAPHYVTINIGSTNNKDDAGEDDVKSDSQKEAKKDTRSLKETLEDMDFDLSWQAQDILDNIANQEGNKKEKEEAFTSFAKLFEQSGMKDESGFMFDQISKKDDLIERIDEFSRLIIYLRTKTEKHTLVYNGKEIVIDYARNIISNLADKDNLEGKIAKIILLGKILEKSGLNKKDVGSVLSTVSSSKNIGKAAQNVISLVAALKDSGISPSLLSRYVSKLEWEGFSKEANSAVLLLFHGLNQANIDPEKLNIFLADLSYSSLDKIKEMGKFLDTQCVGKEKETISKEVNKNMDKGQYKKSILYVGSGGSAFVAGETETHYIIFTNTHVVDNARSLKVGTDGENSPRHTGFFGGPGVLISNDTMVDAAVVLRYRDENFGNADLAILTVKKEDVAGGKLTPIPFIANFKAGDIASRLSGLHYDTSTGYLLPNGRNFDLIGAEARRGSSGSPIVIKTEDGYRTVGVLATGSFGRIPGGIRVTPEITTNMLNALGNRPSEFRVVTENSAARNAARTYLQHLQTLQK